MGTEKQHVTDAPPARSGGDDDTRNQIELNRPGARSRGLAVLILLAGTIALAAHTRGYSDKARDFPLLTLAVMGGLLVLQGILLLFELRRQAPAADRGPSTLGRELKVAGWIGLLGVSVFLLGLMVGAVTFLALYLAANRAARPVIIALIVVLSAAGLYGLFVTMLQVRLPGGLLL